MPANFPSPPRSQRSRSPQSSRTRSLAHCSQFPPGPVGPRGAATPVACALDGRNLVGCAERHAARRSRSAARAVLASPAHSRRAADSRYFPRRHHANATPQLRIPFASTKGPAGVASRGRWRAATEGSLHRRHRTFRSGGFRRTPRSSRERNCIFNARRSTTPDEAPTRIPRVHLQVHPTLW